MYFMRANLKSSGSWEMIELQTQEKIEGSQMLLWLFITVLGRMTTAKWEKMSEFWTWTMNNLYKKHIIFSEHFVQQGKLSEKKPKSSVNDAAVANSGVSVPGKVCLHILLLVVHTRLSSKIISMLIVYIITSSFALSFSCRVNMHFFLKIRNYMSPENVWKTLNPGLYLFRCIELLFARLLLHMVRVAVQHSAVFCIEAA